jgi:hypothetical protein
MSKSIPVASNFKTFKFTKSVECLAAPPKGASLAGKLIVVQCSLDADGNHGGFLLEGDTVERFSVRGSVGFDVSDCAILPPRSTAAPG